MWRLLIILRLDRLLLLLDTGSSTSVRNTAAKQLAQLAAKSVIGDVTTEDDIKNRTQHVSLGDPSAWAELMAVVARVRCFVHRLLLRSNVDSIDFTLFAL